MVTIENETDIIASSLPNGVAWQNKVAPKIGQSKSNLRKSGTDFTN